MVGLADEPFGDEVGGLEHNAAGGHRLDRGPAGDRPVLIGVLGGERHARGLRPLAGRRVDGALHGLGELELVHHDWPPAAISGDPGSM
ncbi:hypothetical protein AB0I93_26970 [Streptomyces sp. NPDC049967]|uniref:hypothetical protein n=1 Tax=Streptomyces sp. NPDC049967 TaxID=3155658 RepID=UPI0034159CEF